MNLDHLLSLVRRPEHLDGTHTADLEALLQEYPYFTAGHLLLLKAYKQQNSIHFKKQLRKVAAIAPDRAQVYALTEAWPEAESVVVDEMGEKLLEEDELLQTEPMAEASITTEVAVEVPTITEVAELPALEEVEAALPKADIEMVEAVEPEASEVAAEASTTASEEAAMVFAFDPKEDQVDGASASTAALPDEELLALVDELAALQTVETEEVLPELELATDEEGALHFAFEPNAPAEIQEQTAAEVTTSTEEPAISEAHMQLNTEQPAELLAEDPAAAVEATVAAESLAIKEPSDNKPNEMLPAVEMAKPGGQETVMATLTPESTSELTAEYAVFVTHAHDRLSWFRFFAAKPLREQPDEVLEQLYMEHMQQDLLQAPAENPVEAIKVRVNTAEEVPSSREMENEIKRLAYDSISDDELPASETLARIYEQQQEYKRAIKIYQKLILKFPDKMTYFAGLIEALRQK
jgi:tetratricopeptide (TPR) repeat protein